MFGFSSLDFFEAYKIIDRHNSIIKGTLNKKTKTSITIENKIKSRIIKVDFNQYKKGTVTVDVTDSYFIIRIPRKTFSNKDKFESFVIELFTQIDQELNSMIKEPEN